MFSDGLLQQILSSLYLSLGPGNGDDPFVGSLDRLINGDVGFGVGSDLADTRAARAYDCTGHVLRYGHMGSLYPWVATVFLHIIELGQRRTLTTRHDFAQKFPD